jgi:hypothetical protein
VLAPLQAKRMPLAESPPRDSRFGSPLKLATVHWVRPEVVVEVTYLTWTEDNLLRQVSYQGQREDKPARKVVRVFRTPIGVDRARRAHRRCQEAKGACRQPRNDPALVCRREWEAQKAAKSLMRRRFADLGAQHTPRVTPVVVEA